MTNKFILVFTALVIAASASGFTNHGVYSKYQGTMISKADGGGQSFEKKKKKKKKNKHHRKHKAAWDNDNEDGDDGEIA